MATADPELSPIIFAVNKILHNGGLAYLSSYYKKGYDDYRNFKMSSWLTEKELEFIKNSTILPIAAFPSNYPYCFFNNSMGEWQGIYFDLLNEVSRLTGLEFKVGHEPNTEFSKVIEKLITGELLIIPELIPTPEREKQLIWSERLLMTDNYALISKVEIPNLSLNEILHFSVGLARNTQQAVTFTKWFPNHKLTKVYDSVDFAFEALKHGEVDLVMSTQRRLMLLTHFQEIVDFKTNIVFSEILETRLVYNKDASELKSIVDKAIKLIDLEHLSTQWTQKTYDQKKKLNEQKTKYFIIFSIILLILLLYLLGIQIKNKFMRKKISKHNDLFGAVSLISSILLNPDLENSDENLIKAMEIIGVTLDIHRVGIWMNYREGGSLYCKMLTEWVSPLRPDESESYIKDTSYDDIIKGWEEILSKDICINKKTRDLPIIIRELFLQVKVMSIFVSPVFVDNKLWGFVSLDDCLQERIFNKNQEIIMKSASRMIANTFIRNTMTNNLIETKTQLESALLTAKEANIAKTDSQRALESILDNLDLLVYTTIPITGKLIFVNKFMRDRFNIGSGDVTNLFCYKVLRNQDTFCEFCPCNRLEKDPDKKIIWEDYFPIVNMRLKHHDVYIDWPNGEKVHLHYAFDITNLHKAKTEAEQSNKYKSSFLATMSHEIRTPMNAILGITELQMQNDSLPEEIDSAFTKIYESGHLLLNIVNDILDLSKIEAGKLELIPVKYDLPSLIVDTVQLNLLRHESKPIDFNIHVDEMTPKDLWGEELRIKQVLNNILSNAFKYTFDGFVELSVKAECNLDNDEEVTLIFKIVDTGQGMTPEQISKLFDEYSRFNLEANRTTIGTGLGMSITKQLVSMMSGSIKVDSELNKGSTFTVFLPQKRISKAVCGPELTGKINDSCYLKSNIKTKTHLSKDHMPDGKVLVVDDIESNIYVAKGMLMAYGLKIDTCSSGQETIEFIKNGAIYDVIFMDHMMPKMDGIETTRILREIGYTNPIVALTANAIVGQSEMFLKNGFDDYISKPIDTRELNSVLNHFIKNKYLNKTVYGDYLSRRGGANPIGSMTETDNN